MALGSLWNHYRDDANDDADENNNDDDFWINKSKTIISKSFEYKTKIISSTSENNTRLDAEVVVPLKYLSNFTGKSEEDDGLTMLPSGKATKNILNFLLDLSNIIE